MRTQSSKQILEPIANAVAQLVVLTSEAELRNEPMPDLSQVALLVQEQVHGLVAVGESMLASAEADELLKRDMKVATEEVTFSARNLVAATGSLATSPFSASSRQALIESVKGLLSGTTSVLSTYDDSEVRKIVTACHTSASQFQALRTVTDISVLVSTVKIACRDLVQLTKMTSARSGELLSPVLCKRLTRALAVLTKRMPLCVTACRAVVSQRDNVHAVNSRDGLCDSMEAACKEIEVVVTMDSWDETMEPSGPVSAALTELNNLFRQIPHIGESGTEKDLEKACSAVDTHVKTVTDSVQDLSRLITDPNTRSAFQSNMRDLRNQPNRIRAASENSRNFPTNAAAQQEMTQSIRAAQSLLDASQAQTNRALITEATQLFSSISSQANPSSELYSLIRTAQSGTKDSVQKIEKDIERLTKAHDKVQLLSSKAIELANEVDPETKRIVKEISNSVRELLPQVVSAARAVVLNPQESAGSLSHLTGVVKAWEDAVQEWETNLVIEEGTFQIQDLVSSARHLVAENIQSVQEAVQNANQPAYEQAVAHLAEAVQRVSAITRLQANNSEDIEYKGELNERIRQMAIGLAAFQSKFGTDRGFKDSIRANSVKLLEQISGVTLAVGGSNLGEPEANPNLPSDSNMHSDKVESSQLPDFTGFSLDEGTKYKKVTEALEPIQELDDVVIVDAEEPKPLSKEEAADNPIAAAAQTLKVTASKWSSADNTIINRSNAVSHKLAQLGETYRLHSASAKKDLIEAARAIVVDTQEIVREALPLVDACTDKRLKNGLSASLERIPTLAQQLRIVAAVKASNPFSRDGEAQLITCAQNLVAAVQQAIQASESASIRVKLRSTATAGVAVVKFKRNVFRRRLANAQGERNTSSSLGATKLGVESGVVPDSHKDVSVYDVMRKGVAAGGRGGKREERKDCK